MENKKEILVVEVVEDEPAILQSLHDSLEREGFAVIVAKDGKEAYKVAVSHHPDLILLDIVLPKIDGLSMLEQLRKDEWGKSVPVIALTAYSDAEKTTKAMELGIKDYLVKTDWNLEDVIRIVKQKLGA